jgi:hypothetical protein
MQQEWAILVWLDLGGGKWCFMLVGIELSLALGLYGLVPKCYFATDT